MTLKDMWVVGVRPQHRSRYPPNLPAIRIALSTSAKQGPLSRVIRKIDNNQYRGFKPEFVVHPVVATGIAVTSELGSRSPVRRTWVGSFHPVVPVASTNMVASGGDRVDE